MKLAIGKLNKVRLNNKGFVASSLLYSLLLLFLALILSLLTLLQNRKMILDKLKKDIKEEISMVNIYDYYENGTVIYYNPVTGNLCNDYTENNSKTGVKEGCLKWYIFNDDVRNLNVNMILDHNTTDNNVNWDDRNTKLASDIEKWNKSLNSRLITAAEINIITGKTEFDANDNHSYYYFENLQQSLNPFPSKGRYGWLYDRTEGNCIRYGCFNNASGTHNGTGYWTDTSFKSVTAWRVSQKGTLFCDSVNYTSLSGVRPVITISKKNMVKIIFNANGGTVDESSKIVDTNSTYGTLPTPKKDGYKFDGWYTENESGTKITSSTNVTAEKIQILYARWIKKSTPEVGDYIKMTPTLTSYTTDTSKTGYENTQTINPSELNIWRVIKVNSDGTIEVVSENVSSTVVYFSGQTGYKNYVGYLNELAGKYTNTKYVKSTRYMGYNGQTEYLTDTSDTVDSTSTTAPWTNSTGSSTVESKGGGDTLYSNDTTLVENSLGTLVAKIPSGTASDYWLASRVYRYFSSTSWRYRGRSIDTSGSVNNYNLYYYNSGFNTSSYGYCLRPILTLKSGIGYTQALGTSDNPFVLS